MSCTSCKEKKNIREEIVKSGEFVPKGIVIFTIVWFILGGYGLYSLIIKLLKKTGNIL